MFKRFRRAALAVCASGVVITAVLAATGATPALAYGKANFELTFAATANFPSTGNSFGFWGWCDLAGGGTAGDCQITQYTHAPAGGGFTCHEDVNLTAWSGDTGTIVIGGSATVNPSSLTEACLSIFPGSAAGNPFSGVDTGFPSAPGHYKLGVEALAGPGAVGVFNINIKQIP